MPTKPRLLFRVEMIVDPITLHAVTSAAGGRAFNMQIIPVPDEAAQAAKIEGESERAANGTTKQVLLPWMLTRPKGKFASADAMPIGAAHGVTKNGIYSCIAKFVKDGLLKRTGPGEFRMTAKGKREARDAQAERVTGEAMPTPTIPPQPHAGNGAAPPKKMKRSQVKEVKHTDFTLQQIMAGNVTYKSLKEAFKTDGRVVRSIDGSLGKLKQDKKIANSGPGEYKLLAKGSAHLKTLQH